MSNNSVDNNSTLSASPTKGRGMLVVVSSPSGGGKGTLIRRALKLVPDLGYSVSFTTRPRREGEVNGRDYFFVSFEEFNSMVEANEFIEWAVVHGNYYGTGRKQVAAELDLGHDIILEIDVQGAVNVRSFTDEAVQIFILPPTYEVLKKRLIGRGSETPSDLALRLKNARVEVEHFRDFDYVIINDDADVAAGQLAAIIFAERLRSKRQVGAAESVISTFPALAMN
jgi:guanylate kinase